jgi:plastocyanin
MRAVRVMMAGVVMAVAACGGGGDDGGGTTAPAVFTTLAVDPANPTVLVGGTQTLTASAKDQTGATMSGLTVTYTSANQAVATVTNAGVVTGVAAGTARITASGTVGTVTKTQDVNVTVAAAGPAASVNATLDSKFAPPTVAVAPNGVVTWTFAAQHNVTFDGLAPTGGNIPNTSSGSVQRTFPSAGTYSYHCTLHAGMSGSVVVQ